MARRRPIEDAPPAVSSSDDEETDDEEEETPNGTVLAQKNGICEAQNDEENGSEDDEGEEEEDDDDEEEKEKLNLPPSKPSKPDSESDSETDSADTESTQPPSPSLSGFTIKPISPKCKLGPNLEQPKKENDGDVKKAKRGAGAGFGGGGSQRLWSDEDEIVILNGMVEYQNEKGKNPFADTGDFHGFVKESLHVDATNNQFLDKMRRLKKKYFTDVDKNEKEIDEIFSKPHDLECVELGKKIWGAGRIEMGKKGNFSKKGGKKEKRAADEEMSGEGEEVNVIVKKQRSLVSDEMNGGGMELSVKKRNVVANKELDGEEAGSEDLWDKYPYLCSSLDGENLPEDVKERTMMMLGMVGEEKLAELESEWRSFMKAKLEFIVMQKNLIAKQIKLTLDAMNSQDS